MISDFESFIGLISMSSLHKSSDSFSWSPHGELSFKLSPNIQYINSPTFYIIRFPLPVSTSHRWINLEKLTFTKQREPIHWAMTRYAHDQTEFQFLQILKSSWTVSHVPGSIQKFTTATRIIVPTHLYYVTDTNLRNTHPQDWKVALHWVSRRNGYIKAES